MDTALTDGFWEGAEGPLEEVEPLPRPLRVVLTYSRDFLPLSDNLRLRPVRD